MTIYNSEKINIQYNVQTDRAEIKSNISQLPLTSIALFLLSDDENRTCFESFKAFILKNFTWSWIVVKDAQGNKTNQIININSIAKWTGLTVKEIKSANKAGNLYETIEKSFDIPSQVKFTELHEKKRMALLDKPFALDESNTMDFLISIENYFKSFTTMNGDPAYLADINEQHLGAIFADFAFTVYPDNRDLIKYWIHNRLESDQFNQIRIESRQRVIDKACENIDALYF